MKFIVLCISLLFIAISSSAISRNIHFGRKLIASALVSSLPLFTPILSVNAVDDIDINCVKQVLRVQKSLGYIEKDINDLGDLPKIINNIKKLQNNYKLDDNIKKTIELTSKNQRENARTHGKSAIEDLAQIYEYFSNEIDQFSGTHYYYCYYLYFYVFIRYTCTILCILTNADIMRFIHLPLFILIHPSSYTGTPKSTRQTLSFALQATQAAEKELIDLILTLPSDVSGPAREEVEKEFVLTAQS